MGLLPLLLGSDARDPDLEVAGEEDEQDGEGDQYLFHHLMFLDLTCAWHGRISSSLAFCSGVSAVWRAMWKSLVGTIFDVKASASAQEWRSNSERSSSMSVGVSRGSSSVPSSSAAAGILSPS